VALEATAQASAAAAVAPQADLAAAQAAFDAADAAAGTILVPGMRDVMEAVFGGFINPGELSISRVISDDDPTDADTDVVLFSGNLSDYTIVEGLIFTEITDNLGSDGRDLVRNVERLVFSDQTLVLVDTGNSVAEGRPTISGIPAVGMTLTASIAGVTDADNGNGGAITGVVDFTWESELEPGSNFFQPIERLGGIDLNGDAFEVHGPSFVLTGAEEGLRIRVMARFQDDALVFESVTSAPVQIGGVAALP
jgi:hypothetical protein